MKAISRSGLILAILFFFFPWVTVSCSGNEVFTFSGIDLAIGKTVEVPEDFLSGKTHKDNVREIRATIGFAIGIIGILLSFLIRKERVQKVILSICGGIGGIFLYLLKIKMDREILKEGGGMLSIDYHFGFYVSLFLFLIVCITGIVSLTSGFEKNYKNYIIPVFTSQGLPKPSFCSQCGTKVSPDDAFCSECGHSLR